MFVLAESHYVTKLVNEIIFMKQIPPLRKWIARTAGEGKQSTVLRTLILINCLCEVRKHKLLLMFHKWTVTGFSLSLGRPDHGCHPLQRGKIPSSELLIVGHFMYYRIRLSRFNQVSTNKMNKRFGNPIGELQIEVDPNNKWPVKNDRIAILPPVQVLNQTHCKSHILNFF